MAVYVSFFALKPTGLPKSVKLAVDVLDPQLDSMLPKLQMSLMPDPNFYPYSSKKVVYSM